MRKPASAATFSPGLTPTSIPTPGPLAPSTGKSKAFARGSPPPQLAALDEISRLISEKTSEMSRTIDLRRDHSVAPALHIMDSGEGLRTMNTIRDSVHELEKHELAELALHSASVSRRAAFFQSVSMIMLVSACAVGGLGAWLLLRRVNELETMITVCAWTRRVKFNGAWVSFEEYLHSRFNLQFTHGISEEASRKLKMEAIELVETNARKNRPAPPVKPV